MVCHRKLTESHTCCSATQLTDVGDHKAQKHKPAEAKQKGRNSSHSSRYSVPKQTDQGALPCLGRDICSRSDHHAVFKH